MANPRCADRKREARKPAQEWEGMLRDRAECGNSRCAGRIRGWGGLMGQVVDRLGFGEPGRGRAEAVAETLAAKRGTGEGPEELAHDARNMCTALELYCELLDEPGVLAPRFRHYGSELRLVVAASRRLVDKLAAFELAEALQIGYMPRGRGPARGESAAPGRLDSRQDPRHGLDGLAEPPIADLAVELEGKRNLL